MAFAVFRFHTTISPAVPGWRRGAAGPARGPGVRRHRRRRIVAAVVALVLLAAFGVATGRLFIWPDLPKLPGHADAIIELGGPGNRDGVALGLARHHRARFLVQSTTAEEARTGKCLPAVPGVTILCMHADPNTTRGEAESIGRLAKQYNWTSVILVTSPDHAWRARLRVTRCFGGDIYASTTRLPLVYWPRQIPYQWAATVKALTVQRTC
jgi:hypothetical protein